MTEAYCESAFETGKNTLNRAANLLPFLVLLFAAAANSAVVINPFLYGDNRNSCYEPFKGTLRGEVAWAKKHSNSICRNIALHGDQVILCGQRMVTVHAKDDGRLVWQAQSSLSLSFLSIDTGIVSVQSAYDTTTRQFRSAASLLEYGNGNSSPADLTFKGPEIDLLYCRWTGDTCIYFYKTLPCVNSPGTGEGGCGGVQWNLVRREMKTEEDLCILEYFRTVDFFASSNDHKEFFFNSYGKLFYASDKTCNPSNILEMPLKDVTSFSIAGSGEVIAAVNSSVSGAIVRYDPASKQEKKTPLKCQRLLPVPPAVSPAGTVVCLAPDGIYAIAGSTLAWVYKFKETVSSGHITLLADSSVLAAAATMFWHISGTGKVLAARRLESPVQCRPVMDQDGFVYIATEKELVKLK